MQKLKQKGLSLFSLAILVLATAALIAEFLPEVHAKPLVITLLVAAIVYSLTNLRFYSTS